MAVWRKARETELPLRCHTQLLTRVCTRKYFRAAIFHACSVQRIAFLLLTVRLVNCLWFRLPPQTPADPVQRCAAAIRSVFTSCHGNNKFLIEAHHVQVCHAAVLPALCAQQETAALPHTARPAQMRYAPSTQCPRITTANRRAACARPPACRLLCMFLPTHVSSLAGGVFSGQPLLPHVLLTSPLRVQYSVLFGLSQQPPCVQ